MFQGGERDRTERFKVERTIGRRGSVLGVSRLASVVAWRANEVIRVSDSWMAHGLRQDSHPYTVTFPT